MPEGRGFRGEIAMRLSEYGFAEGASRNRTRPALASAARLLCRSARITGEPCADCIKLAASVVHNVMRELPNEYVRPSDIDNLIRIHSMDA